MESKEAQNIDTNLYSRQIGTFGLETMSKLVQMKVAIIGQRGLGVEIAKNLILAGPKQVILIDTEETKIADLGANFYLSEADLGKERGITCVNNLKALNPYVEVITGKPEDLMTLIAEKKLDVVCQTELIINGKFLDPKEVDAACRAAGVGYISSQTFGPWGYAFVDYGKEHTIFDHDGEQTKSYIVTLIESKEDKTVITVHEDKRHIYQEGDYVSFKEVQGMSEINNLPPAKIIATTVYSITIDLDTSKFSQYTRQGMIENIKVPKKVEFNSFEDSLKNPLASTQYGMFETPDLSKFGRSDQLHFALYGIYAFMKANNKFPENIDADVKTCEDLAKGILNDAEFNCEEIDAKVFSNAIRYAKCSISPMAAFFGGIIAQEIVKYTGKYSPLKQWLHFDIYETLPREAVNTAPLNCRYDDQIYIFGQELQEKLKKVNLFMVGAGALGCEYIKAFALMGVGCDTSGKVYCTDNDNIEISNLNRQFLFRKDNVGHSKSEVACKIAKGINKDLNVQSFVTRVGSDTEDVFNDPFWEGLDFIVNAVDNINARLYVDSRCVWYEKPLLESGTLGTKANSQMIVPHKTQCYGDSQDPPEEAIPMCTLRNFPNEIEHCIEWGRDKFNEHFVDTINDVDNYLKDPKQFMIQLDANSTSAGSVASFTKMVDLIKMKVENSYENCVRIARSQFDVYYNYSIRDLLSIFPHDAVNKEGQPFWSGPKRAPSPIEFDVNKEIHFEFVQCFANLIAEGLKIEKVTDIAAIAAMAKSVSVPDYIPKKIVVKLPEEEKDNGQPAQAAPEDPEDDVLIKNLKQELLGLKEKVTQTKFCPADFEKDDDSNFHIAFINATANLRATNYQITNCDKQKTKMIAGKIIPAIATTTAMITGAVSAEIYKFVQGYTELENVKNAFINLALPLFLFSEPTEVNKIKSKDYDPIAMCKTISIPEGYTIYDKTVVDMGSLTFQELFDYLKEKYKIEVTLVSAGNFALYNAYLPGNRQKARLPLKVEDVYKTVSENTIADSQYYLQLELGGTVLEVEEEADFQMPTLKYCFKPAAK